MIDENYLVRVIERLVEKTVEKRVRPAKLTIGTVVSAEPLSVKLSPELTLPEGALIVDDRFKKYEITTEEAEGHTHIVKLDNRLKEGDKVRLLGDTGGQRYYILGRV